VIATSAATARAMILMAPFALMAATAFWFSYRRMSANPPSGEWLDRARAVRRRALLTRVWSQDVLWQLRVAENPRIAFWLALVWCVVAVALLVLGSALLVL
jgi:hypothetical protein